tara:strand:+ start:557 stop:817 length:261 start_codon:yes stop_codon:yes gene_type:complete
MIDLVRGESVQPTEDYDLFGVNVNGCKGIYLKTDESTGKLLVFFPINQEWGELLPKQVHRISPGEIPEDNQSFIDHVATLQYSFET